MELARELELEKAENNDEEDFTVSDSSKDTGSPDKKVSFGDDLTYSA